MAGYRKNGINFATRGDYKKWLAYGHMHKKFEESPGNTPVKIKGRAVKVKHSK